MQQTSGCEKRSNSVDDVNPVLSKRKLSAAETLSKQASKSAKKTAALEAKKAMSFECEPPQLPPEREVCLCIVSVNTMPQDYVHICVCMYLYACIF